jgi:2-methylcitrate dehydratase PrpD
MMSRIEVTVETGLQADGRGKFPMPGIVTVTEKNERKTQEAFEYVKGHPNNPMSFDEVAEKFRDCARFGRPDWNNLEEVVQLVAALQDSQDAGKLVGHCAQTIAA